MVLLCVKGVDFSCILTKLSYDVKTIRRIIETPSNEPQQDKEDGETVEELQNE